MDRQIDGWSMMFTQTVWDGWRYVKTCSYSYSSHSESDLTEIDRLSGLENVQKGQTITTLIKLLFFFFIYQSDGIRHENHIYICTRRQSVIWLGVSFAYKGSLQVIAMFMAFHTRRVKVKALNDSKEIAAIIYFNSIILSILAVTEFALQHYHDVYAALFGLALLIEASLFLGLIFVPKVCKYM